MGTTERITVRGLLREGMSQLSAANVPSQALAAELLLMYVLQHDRAWIYAHPEAPLDSQAVHQYLQLIARRTSGEPTQYLTGHQEFWGLDFEVTPDVLIPRPETEHLIEVALQRLVSKEAATEIRMVDVGTGSGCIAVALAKEFPSAQILAIDISERALAIARRNAARHQVADRIQFVRSDLLHSVLPQAHANTVPGDPISHGQPWECADVIISNPPYVARNEEVDLPREVREHEPHQALFGGPTGVEIYAKLIEQSKSLLKPGGLLILELGYNSLEHVRETIESCRVWSDLMVTNDLAGIPRVVSATSAR